MVTANAWLKKALGMLVHKATFIFLWSSPSKSSFSWEVHTEGAEHRPRSTSTWGSGVARLLLGFSPAQRSGHSIFFFRTQLNRVSVKLRLKEYLVYGKPCANEGLKKGRWGISTLWKIVTGGCQLSQEGRACRPPGSLGAGLSCAVNLYSFGPPQISEPTADKTTFVTVRDCS